MATVSKQVVGEKANVIVTFVGEDAEAKADELAERLTRELEEKPSRRARTTKKTT